MNKKNKQGTEEDLINFIFDNSGKDTDVGIPSELETARKFLLEDDLKESGE